MLGDYHRKCPVFVFRVTSQHLRFHSCLLIFFFRSNSRYVQVDESQYEPLLVKEVISLLLLCEKSLMCEDFSMSNVHLP